MRRLPACLSRWSQLTREEVCVGHPISVSLPAQERADAGLDESCTLLEKVAEDEAVALDDRAAPAA